MATRKTHHATVARMERNIIRILDQSTTQERIDGAAWYATARARAYDVARRFDVGAPTVVRVLAALSPRNRWERNLCDAVNVIAAWRNGAPIGDVKVGTFNANREHAWAILQGSTTASGPKVTAFNDNILRESSRRVTVDIHARKVAQGWWRSSDDLPALGAPEYRAIEQAYVNVADRLGYRHAYQLQAVVWLTWRRVAQQSIRNAKRRATARAAAAV